MADRYQRLEISHGCGVFGSRAALPLKRSQSCRTVRASACNCSERGGLTKQALAPRTRAAAWLCESSDSTPTIVMIFRCPVARNRATSCRTATPPISGSNKPKTIRSGCRVALQAACSSGPQYAAPGRDGWQVLQAGKRFVDAAQLVYKFTNDALKIHDLTQVFERYRSA